MDANDWSNLSLRAQEFVAGAAGGLVRWLTLRSHWVEGTISVIIGAISALYLQPLVQPAIDQLVGSFVIDPTSRSSFSGFVLGLGGVSVTGFLIDIWKSKRGGK